MAIAMGDVAVCVEQAQRALAVLPGENHHLRGSAAALLGLAHLRNGELESAYTSIADGMAELALTGNVAFANSAAGGLAE